jgi:hypothetical protein
MCGKGKLRPLVLLASLAALVMIYFAARAPQILDAQDALGGQTESTEQLPNVRNDRRLDKGDGAPNLSKKQLDAIIRSNLSKSKKDAQELADVARQLHQELSGPNATDLSAEDQLRLEKIEKLAKKIRGQMRGY